MSVAIQKLEAHGLFELLSNKSIPYGLRRSISISEADWISLRKMVLSNYESFNPNDLNLYAIDDEGDYTVDERNYSIISTWLEHFIESDIVIGDFSDEWSGYIENLYSKPLNDDEYFSKTIRHNLSDYYSNRRNKGDVHILAATFSDSFDWTKFFNAVTRLSYYSLRYSTSRTIVDNYAKTQSDGFHNFMSENIFSKSSIHEVRGFYYPYFIKHGYLTKKTARKIRSESSAAASVSGVNALFDSKDKYSNFEELVTQFVDSKYPDVTYELAKRLPMDMVSYLVGCEHWHTKRTVEKRMEEFFTGEST